MQLWNSGSGASSLGLIGATGKERQEGEAKRGRELWLGTDSGSSSFREVNHILYMRAGCV